MIWRGLDKFPRHERDVIEDFAAYVKWSVSKASLRMIMSVRNNYPKPDADPTFLRPHNERRASSLL